ncbi:MAG: hypothetical protein M3070_18505 [Actinomycetota bacterium]|nr:hypothetical protein [Actinomycetota bacterium]
MTRHSRVRSAAVCAAVASIAVLGLSACKGANSNNINFGVDALSNPRLREK